MDKAALFQGNVTELLVLGGREQQIKNQRHAQRQSHGKAPS
jgi:hypothetical protein